LKRRKTWSHLDVYTEEGTRELCQAVCWEHGAIGIEEDVPFPGSDRVYFETVRAAETVVKILSARPDSQNIRIIAGSVTDPGWRTAWHAFFTPVNAGRRFRILPSWCPPASMPADDRIPLRIYPGQAFGTGHHESTRLCLHLMENIPMPGSRVFDAGCGSGILGIAAALTGAERVVGRDLEMEAVDEAAVNARLNGCAQVCEWHVGSVLSEKRDFDVVLANLNTVLLKDIGGNLCDRLAPGGRLVISGFLINDIPDITVLMMATGRIECVTQEILGEWAAVLMRRSHEN